MEDLREVGQNSLDAINKLGASDVGDLVLGIGDLIEELYDAPEDKREGKLEHLRGLFREFAHGEEYAFRDERLEPQQPEDPNSVTGIMPNVLSFPPVSGALPAGYVLASGVYNPPSPSSLIPPQTPSRNATMSNPCGELPLKASSFDDDADYEEEEEEEIEEEPKEFVKRWWNSQQQDNTQKEQLDD